MAFLVSASEESIPFFCGKGSLCNMYWFPLNYQIHSKHKHVVLFFFFLVRRVWNQGRSRCSTYLSHTSSPFCSGYFRDWVLRTVCPGWPQTSIFLISVSQIIRITGMSYRYRSHSYFESSSNKTRAVWVGECRSEVEWVPSICGGGRGLGDTPTLQFLPLSHQ
jgi:hypothetical protein